MNKHPLFSQKCWSFTLPRHEEYKRLINQVLLVDQNDPNFRISTGHTSKKLEGSEQTNVYAWRSDWHSHLHFPILEKLCEELKSYLAEIIKEEKVQDTSEIEVVDCWINKYKKNDFAVPHRHGNDEWVSVYFMKIPKDSKSIFRVHNPLGHTYKSGLTENFATLDINATEGSIIIMSGAMRHEVTPNMSEKERVTIAMNFRMFNKFPFRTKEK